MSLCPPFLLNTDPLEIEDIPLQVALLTMEVASLREKIAMLARELMPAAAPDQFDQLAGEFLGSAPVNK